MATRPITPEEKAYADELMKKARVALEDIAGLDQAQVDRLCQAVAWATANEKTFERIARMGVDESGIGDWENRVGKRFKVMSAVCTHLGCTVRVEASLRADPSDPDTRRATQVFQLACPCHGSRYREDGSNISGPAPRPLPAYRLTLAPDDGQLVVDLDDEIAPDVELTVP